MKIEKIYRFLEAINPIMTFILGIAVGIIISLILILFAFI